MPSGTVLAIAAWLTPDPSGLGTHKQLGLSGCALLTYTGIPCPMCGMTTTFTHLAHGEVVPAILNQPFGAVLFMLTVGIALLGLLELVRPARRMNRIMEALAERELWVAGGLLAGLVLGWFYKIAWMNAVFPWHS